MCHTHVANSCFKVAEGSVSVAKSYAQREAYCVILKGKSSRSFDPDYLVLGCSPRS